MMLYSIDPIPTWYAGILFDSQHEAQYAAFFDLLGLKWQYHPLPRKTIYGWEPDFLLWLKIGNRTIALLVEVKPHLFIRNFEKSKPVAFELATRGLSGGVGEHCAAVALFGISPFVSHWQIDGVEYFLPELFKDWRKMWMAAGNMVQPRKVVPLRTTSPLQMGFAFEPEKQAPAKQQPCDQRRPMRHHGQPIRPAAFTDPQQKKPVAEPPRKLSPVYQMDEERIRQLDRENTHLRRQIYEVERWCLTDLEKCPAVIAGWQRYGAIRTAERDLHHYIALCLAQKLSRAELDAILNSAEVQNMLAYIDALTRMIGPEGKNGKT